jgi:hypothetical protein
MPRRNNPRKTRPKAYKPRSVPRHPSKPPQPRKDDPQK